MSDEPVEDGDSGSDAEGASSTSGSRNDAPDSGASADPEPEDPKGATEPDEESKEEGTEEPAEIEETPTWDGDSWVPPDDEAEAEESEGAEPQPDDGDATGGEDASEEDDGADSPDSDSPDPDAADESEGEGAAEPPTDRRGSGRARMGSRPPPGDHSEQRSGDEPDADAAAAPDADAAAVPDADAAAVPAADADADSASDGAAQSEEDQEERVSHHDPDDFGSTPGQPEYATDKLDDEDVAPEAGDGDAEHPDAPGTPDDRPRRNPKERSPRGSAHSRGGAKGRSQPDAATSSSTAVTDDGGSGGSSILSGGIGGSAPPDDEEMPLTEHIEEMLTRLAIVVVVAAFATLAAFPFANDIIIEMWYDVHTGTVQACKTSPQSGDCVAPHVYGPLELVLTRIRVAGLAGLLAALPLGVYQTYRFMRPGLYPHERRYYLAAVPFSLLLAIIGMLFAYFVLLPLLFAYFIGYTQGSADLAFQLAETMNLILLMMGMLAIIFQIPLLIMLAIMMGITTRRWLERRRLYFWGLFLGVAVIFGPDPTGMAPFLLMATMVALFEGTLLLLRWTGR